MENSRVAQKINTSIKHVVPKNQIFSDMFSIFQGRLKLGGKKTVINFFGLGPKKIMPRCRAHFSKQFCNSSQNSISSLSSRKIELKFFFYATFLSTFSVTLRAARPSYPPPKVVD
jgi:hypothetical protein